MAFLFDTDAISELLRPRPAAAFVKWILEVPREEQFTSAVVMGELYKGAYRSGDRERHLSNIEHRVLPAVTVLPYDISTAKVFGRIRAHLEDTGPIEAHSLLPGRVRPVSERGEDPADLHRGAKH